MGVIDVCVCVCVCVGGGGGGGERVGWYCFGRELRVCMRRKNQKQGAGCMMNKMRRGKRDVVDG